jgi:hypothetical protein
LKNQKLLRLIFMALCCDLGLFAKRIIAPFANILTDSLHIPGGIGTAFSLLFLVVAAMIIPKFGTATLMAAVQSILALAFGMVGSMGALAPIGYIVPGVVIDTVLLLGRRSRADYKLSMMLANMLGSVSAGLAANIIVFRLPAIPLALYSAVALFSGAVCGLLAAELYCRVAPILGRELRKDI